MGFNEANNVLYYVFWDFVTLFFDIPYLDIIMEIQYIFNFH
jgi:hypothetical protein